MHYPREFIEEVRVAYPHEPRIIDMLENGMVESVGRWFAENAYVPLTQENAANLMLLNQEDQVQGTLRRIDQRIKVRIKWKWLVGKMRGPGHGLAKGGAAVGGNPYSSKGGHRGGNSASRWHRSEEEEEEVA